MHRLVCNLQVIFVRFYFFIFIKIRKITINETKNGNYTKFKPKNTSCRRTSSIVGSFRTLKDPVRKANIELNLLQQEQGFGPIIGYTGDFMSYGKTTDDSKILAN